MSRRIPLFPLPDVVLLPGTLLPLHVFEPRYRAMVADALAGEKTIGMTMLVPGADAAATAPPIHPVGTAGEIVESETLPDGRYNILLEARFRFRVIDEDRPDPYRVARVEELPTTSFREPGEQERLVSSANDLFRDVARALDLPPLPSEALSPERLASEIALRLRYAPPELQELLETDSLPERFEVLRARMLEWKSRLLFLAPFRPRQLDPRRN
ncbi:MAG TPA: LON peptidase substrate-binding domain-containing protein [Thermoanaerobaculia bacterium]|nr:LON peptidase substrate-binding domain-containing protein [Thermoanaerobaculia bacterium]